MNDRQLDELIARYGDDYNRERTTPDIESILENVHRGLHERGRAQFWPAAATLAAAAAILVAIYMRPDKLPETVQAVDATSALQSAISSAEAARKAHPDDPYYARHLSAMKENAAEFEKLSARLSQSL